MGFQLIVALILVFPVLSFIIYKIKGKKVFKPQVNAINDYGIIVTAYKYTGNLNNVIDSLLKLNHNRYIIYVVADDCEGYNYEKSDDRVVILHPPSVFKNQVKSHFYAIENFKRNHNIITIIDSDNIVHPEYLNEIDIFFNLGFKAVQGVRKAKNFNSVYACLDAINELYYLLYDRIILFSIGSSSMLSGSGMAFTTELYKECLGPLNTEGAGFDKVLQNQILSRNLRIAFAENAIVYDEKTADPSQLVKQRARWNNTWFRYFRYSIQLMAKGIKNFSLNQFLYGFLLFRPPLFILIVLCLMITLANIFIDVNAVVIWIALLAVFTFGFLNALVQLKADKRLYRSLLFIPKFMFLQILSLMKAKKANELSVATEHSFHKAAEEIEN